MSRLRLFWEGTLFARHSLALVNRQLCLRLAAHPGIDLSLVPFEPDEDDFGPRYEKLRALDVRSRGFSIRGTGPERPLWVRHLWPPRQRPPGALPLVTMLPWEYSSLPETFAQAISRSAEVWTPSTFSREALCRSGLSEEKVHVVPYGVDPGVFTPDGSRLSLPTRSRFRFLFVGGTIHRKGIDILLEAYGRAFRAKDDVCLVIQDLSDAAVYRGQTAEAAIAAFQAGSENPEVLHLTRFLHAEELAALYRSCQAFVSPYRGEGFSLPSLEAMACGLPVLVTAGGATDDFVDDEVGWRIPAARRSLGSSVYGQPTREQVFLLEPDPDVLATLLTGAREGENACVARGEAGRRRAVSRFTWDHTVETIVSRAGAVR